jgi:Transposase Tn5 dimerisation domain/Transposase DNA-binding
MNDPIQPWVHDELAGADFGDERLDQRFSLVLDRLSRKPSLAIPAACGGRAEAVAAYRFFANAKVRPDRVLAPHYRATLARIAAQPRAFLVQDTTEIDLTRPAEVVGGPLDGESRRGLLDHALVAFTPDGAPLGVVAARLWARQAEAAGKGRKQKKKENRKRPLQDKESFRWLEAYRRACAVACACPATEVVCLSDSEGDVYECYAEALAAPAAARAHWIIRACQDRNLHEAERGLFEEVASGPVLLRLEVEVRQRPAKSGDGRKRKQARQRRVARVTVQAASVLLAAPERPGGRAAPVRVNCVLVREAAPPQGEPPLEWLLLTDLPVGTAEEALAVVEGYCVRWNIEVYFRVLKGGCRVEELQLEEDRRIEACLALYMIVAWRVLLATRLGRECPEVSCEAVFAPEEWQALYAVSKKEVPASPPPLGEVVKLVAALGGWLGRKGDGPPGPKAMWIGLQRLADFATAWLAFGPAPRPPPA